METPVPPPKPTPEGKSRGRRGGGTIYQTKDGTWVSQVSLGYRSDGTRIRPTVSGASLKEVQARRKELLKKVDVGVIDASTETVGSYMRRWLAMLPGKPAYLRREQDTVNCYIAPPPAQPGQPVRPGVGHIKLTKLNALHVESWLEDLKKIPYRSTAKDPGARSRQMAFGTLRRALETAVAKHLIPRNPTDGIPTPRHEAPERKPWTDEEVETFMLYAEKEALGPGTKREVAARYSLFALVSTAIGAGMREGELCGAQWPDLDLQTSQVSVHQQQIELGGRMLGLASVKSRKGNRTIALPATLVETLRTHLRHQLAVGATGSGYVFCTWSRKLHTWVPYRKSNLLRAFKAAVRRSGVRVVTIHDLRHANETGLLARRVPVNVVAAQGGHDPNVLLKTYAHVVSDQQREAAEKADELFGAARKSKGGGNG